MYVDYQGSLMGHKWVPHIWRTLHTFNGTKHNNLLVFRIPRSINATHMSASYMENITLLQWDKNNKFLYGEFHVPSMGHKWVYRVRRISRPFNGTHSSASFMEKATLLEWDKIGCIVYGECYAPSIRHKRAPRFCVWRMSCAFNGTQMSTSCIEHITLLQ